VKEDRRIRRTKSAIKEAFIDLLNEKEIEKITIQDITKRADINRGTFYLHFEDKYLLLDKMENECIAEISNVTEFYNVLGNDAEETGRLFIKNVLTTIFHHIDRNINFYRTILKLDRTSRLEEKMNSLFKENMQNYISVDHVIAGIPEMYFYRYVSGATISVMKYWVQDPKRLPVDELILYIYKIVYNGPLRLLSEHRHHMHQHD